MNVSGTTTLNAETVERTVKVVEILTGVENEDAKYDEVFTEDKYDSTPNVEYYNNYTKDGKTINSTNNQQTVQAGTITKSETVAVSSTQIGNTPDIISRNLWEDPLIKEIQDLCRKIYEPRANESKSTSDPYNHAWKRYFDPTASHYVGHDLSDWEKQFCLGRELEMMKNPNMFIGHNGFSQVDPVTQGRGLSRSSGNVQRITPHNSKWTTAGQMQHNRKMVTSQLNNLFNRNGIIVPENLRLSFTIDSQFRLRVTGTDDESLIKRIEELLNRNGNSQQLYDHILQSTRTRDYECISDQVQEGSDSLRQYRVDWAIRNYTDYTRQDLDLVNGKFLTKDGIDIMELIREGMAKEHGEDNVHLFAGSTQRELDWLAKTGPDNIPDLTLTINYENGNLFDVGQPYGYGPGQTDWISELLGGKDPYDSNAWLA